MLGGKVVKIGQKAVLEKRHLLYDFSHYDFEVRAFREKTCRKASWTWGFKLEVQQHQRFAEIQSFEVLNSSSFGTKEALINIVTHSLTSCNFIQCIVNASQWMLVPILNLTAIQCGSCTLHYVRQATIKASFIEKLLWGAQWSWVFSRRIWSH